MNNLPDDPKIPTENVVLSLVTAFNLATQDEKYDATALATANGFFNSLADLIRARDPKALQPGYTGFVHDIHGDHGIFTGNSQKIVKQLKDIFKDAYEDNLAILSEHLKGQGEPYINKGPFALGPHREIILTLTEPLRDVIKKEKLPISAKPF